MQTAFIVVSRPLQSRDRLAFLSVLLPVFLVPVFFVLFLCTCCPAVEAQEPAQDEVPLAPRQVPANELYRLRVENVMYGSVCLSADGGRHYTLIGRVLHPASAIALERAASTPGDVLRSSTEGVAFAVNLGQTLKLLPASLPSSVLRHAPSTSERSAIVTNIAPRNALFGDLPLPPGAAVKLEVDGRALRPFPTLYEPSSDDVFVFLIPPDDQHPAGSLSERLTALGQAYTAQALALARQEHRAPVVGTLTLKAKLPDGEPDPIAYVTYAIDSRQVSTQNVPPYNYEWDTRQAADGEHLVEVRALNRNGHVITSKRALVFVQNKPN